VQLIRLVINRILINQLTLIDKPNIYKIIKFIKYSITNKFEHTCKIFSWYSTTFLPPLVKVTNFMKKN